MALARSRALITRAEHESCTSAGRVNLRANVIALNRRKHTQMSTYRCPHLKEPKKSDMQSRHVSVQQDTDFIYDTSSHFVIDVFMQPFYNRPGLNRMRFNDSHFEESRDCQLLCGQTKSQSLALSSVSTLDVVQPANCRLFPFLLLVGAA